MFNLYNHATAVEAMRGLFTGLENRAGNTRSARFTPFGPPHRHTRIREPCAASSPLGASVAAAVSQQERYRP